MLAILAATLLWRLPSLFDPPWVNDEGTYFAVAQAMAHGYRLYGDVWENKPPALYLIYDAVYHSAGVSLLAIRLLSAASVLTTAALTVLIARRFVGRAPALVSGLLLGLLMGVPFLEGTTGNAEVFLTACTSAAVLLALRGHLVAPGILMAFAVLLKVVALFDAAALGLLVLGYCRAGPLLPIPGAAAMRRALVYAGALSVPLTFAIVLAQVAGILGSMLQDALFYPLGYVGHANGGGVPWLVLIKLLALACITAWLRGRPFPLLWLAWASAGALISGRFFGHYALQAVPPLCVAVGIAASAHLPSRRQRTLLILLPALFALAALGAASIGWSMTAAGHDSILARRLQWYANFTRLAIGEESYATYRNQVDDHVTRNLHVVQDLRSMPPGRLLVWGNAPWVYALSDRLPATPYTSALRDPEVPGETASLRRAVTRQSAAVVVVVAPPLPPLGRAHRALTRKYREATRVRDATLYAARARQGRQRG